MEGVTRSEAVPLRRPADGLVARLDLIDSRQAVLGSVNLDPRSKDINTEMAVSIDHDGLATEAADAISPLLEPENSSRVMLGPNRDLCWESDTTTLHRQTARSGR